MQTISSESEEERSGRARKRSRTKSPSDAAPSFDEPKEAGELPPPFYPNPSSSSNNSSSSSLSQLSRTSRKRTRGESEHEEDGSVSAPKQAEPHDTADSGSSAPVVPGNGSTGSDINAEVPRHPGEPASHFFREHLLISFPSSVQSQKVQVRRLETPACRKSSPSSYRRRGCCGGQAHAG